VWPEVLYVIVNFSPVSVYWFGLYHGLSATRPGSLLEVPVLPVPVSGLAGHFSPMSLVAPLPLDGTARAAQQHSACAETSGYFPYLRSCSAWRRPLGGVGWTGAPYAQQAAPASGRFQ